MLAMFFFALVAAVNADGLQQCKNMASELNRLFATTFDCPHAPGTPSWYCSGLFLTVRSTFAPLDGATDGCPTTKALLDKNETDGCYPQSTVEDASWCPYKCGGLDDTAP